MCMRFIEREKKKMIENGEGAGRDRESHWTATQVWVLWKRWGKVLGCNTKLTKSHQVPWAVVTRGRNSTQALAGNSQWEAWLQHIVMSFRLSRGPWPIMQLGELRGTFSCETLEWNNRIKWGYFTQMIRFLLLYTYEFLVSVQYS